MVKVLVDEHEISAKLVTLSVGKVTYNTSK